MVDTKDFISINGEISMAITQIGVSTLSEEALQYITELIKAGALSWSDLSDTPDYNGEGGKYLNVQYDDGGSSVVWANLPASGVSWNVETSDVYATDKMGILASNGLTVYLPTNPEEGTVVNVSDHKHEFDVRPVEVKSTGGYTIGDSEYSILLDMRGAYVQFVHTGVSWSLAQTPSPLSVREITEEVFPGGTSTFTMDRIPPNKNSILVIIGGKIIPTSQYQVSGSKLTVSGVPSDSVIVRHIGIPASGFISDTPIGMLAHFPNNSYVEGWLDADGSQVSRSLYPDLVKYLSKDTFAESVALPDYRGKFLRAWSYGTDTVDTHSIPSALKDNAWGKWVPTTTDSTSANLWDARTDTGTRVLFDKAYVAYEFDAPVKVTSADIYSFDAVGLAHLPSSVVLKASVDGVSWIDASVPFSGTIHDRTVGLTSVEEGSFRFWGVFGTGGTAYPDGSGLYWGVSSLVFNGTSFSRVVGDLQTQSVGDVIAADSIVGLGPVQSGTGSIALAVGGTGDASLGAETRPDNISTVVRIKAFHYQSGEISRTDVGELRAEVSRLTSAISANSLIPSEDS